MKNHRDIDQRSLAFGRLIADRVRENPALIGRAKATLERWLSDCSPRARASLNEWRTILDGPIEGVLELLISEDERSTRLRQSNPFAGVLSRGERDAIIRRFHNHDTQAA